MNRTLFYEKETVNGIVELDFLNNTLSDLRMNRRPMFYKVVQEDLGSFDLISKKAYGSEEYWWVICLVNDILDISSDIAIGDILTIPSILDVFDFYKKRVRR